jgi:hypothetical protein
MIGPLLLSNGKGEKENYMDVDERTKTRRTKKKKMTLINI